MKPLLSKTEFKVLIFAMSLSILMMATAILWGTVTS